MSQALALSSILGFAALFAAIWIMHRPLNVHSCPRAGVRAAHRVLEWALVAYAVVLVLQAWGAVASPPANVSVGEALGTGQGGGLLVRLVEIEVRPEWLAAYLSAAQGVGAESAAKEPGVVGIFLMRKTESPTSIRRVEIYRDAAACQAHLATPRFRAYQEGTQHMIKSL